MQILFDLLLISSALPSGNILGFPIKILLALIIMILIIAKKKLVIDKNTILLAISFSCIVFWSVESYLLNYSIKSIYLCLKSFSSLLMVLMISIVLYKNKLIDLLESLRVLRNTFIIYVLFKIIIEVLFVFNFISLDRIKFIMMDLLGAEMMTLEFTMGNLVMCRFSTPNDVIPVLLLGVDLIMSQRSKLVNILMIVALGMFSLITYSRVTIIHYIITLAISGFIYINNKKQNQYIKYIMIIAVFLFSYINTSFFEELYHVMEFRFNSVQSDYSDSIRAIQYDIFINNISESLFFGQGLGSYIPSYVRSTEVLFSYELEYLSFLYQFGIIGCVLIVFPIILVAYNMSIYKTHNKHLKMILLLNFLFWLVRPVFNPQFLSSASGFFLISMFLLKEFYNNHEQITM